MPIRPENRGLYPANWKQIRARILARAGNRCEHPGCGAPNGTLIIRRDDKPEIWRWAPTPDAWSVELGAYGWRRPVTVVLTIAHLDQDPTHNDESNLRALCQLHHLRLDARQHAATAAETRARKKAEAAGQTELFPRGRP